MYSDAFDIDDLLFIIIFLCLKKNKDYIFEFNSLRNLTLVSIHQRRVREDGSYDRMLDEKQGYFRISDPSDGREYEISNPIL